MKNHEPQGSHHQTPPDPGGGHQQPPAISAEAGNMGAGNPMEFWAMLAKSAAMATNPAMLGAPVLQQPPIQTNIRLPPAFNLTAAIQHMLRTAQQQNTMHGIPQNAAMLLQHLHAQTFNLAQQKQQEQQMARDESGIGVGEIETADGQHPPRGTDSPEEEATARMIKEEEEEPLFGLNHGNLLAENVKAAELGEEDDSGLVADESAALDDSSTTTAVDGSGGGGLQKSQQRRPRVGGSSAKTAEVWRFFTQRPNGEQAATCSICNKTIKATNSSTTGMIRHLRSCHHEQHLILQQARTLRTLKNADETMREQLLRQLGISTAEGSFEAIQAALESSLLSSSLLQSPLPTSAASEGVSPMPKQHSVEALISPKLEPDNHPHHRGEQQPHMATMAGFGAFLIADQRQLLEQIENFKSSRPTSMERQQKKEAAANTSGPTVDGQQNNSSVSKRSMGQQTAPNNNSSGAGEGGGSPPVGCFREPKRRKEEFPTEQSSPFFNGASMAMASPLPTKSSSNGTPKVAGVRKQRKPTTNLASRDEERDVRISEQMAAMFMMDSTEFLLDRPAFRQFVQSLVPHYQMPSKDQFKAEIMPRVARQLEQMALFRDELQRNNPFGPPLARQHLLNCSASSSSSVSTNQSSGSPPLLHFISNNNSVISPSSSAEESGFHDEESSTTTTGTGMAAENTGQPQEQHGHLKMQKSAELDELVQLATIRSQNISRGFTHSLDLNAANNEGSCPPGMGSTSAGTG